MVHVADGIIPTTYGTRCRWNHSYDVWYTLQIESFLRRMVHVTGGIIPTTYGTRDVAGGIIPTTYTLQVESSQVANSERCYGIVVIYTQEICLTYSDK